MIRWTPAASAMYRNMLGWLADSAGEATTVRFIAAVDRTLAFLDRSPRAGFPAEFGRVTLIGVRRWNVQRFRNYAIFYRPDRRDIIVVAIVHAARDLPRLLEEQEGPRPE
ncbi:MAG: type II toxin-antitoxin system RelE/ParE family toxin [Phycisphaerales bacterium]